MVRFGAALRLAVRACLLCGVLLAGGGLRAQQDGALRWQAPVGGFVTYSSPAVSADGKTIFIGVETAFGDGRLVALTSEGRRAWPGDSAFLTSEPIESAPALSRDGTVVYFGCNNGKVYALDARTGTKNWEAVLGSVVSGSPAVAEDGTIYIGCDDNWLYALTDHGKSFEMRRLLETKERIFSTPAIGRDGTIYVSSLDRNLYAVTPQGQLKWPPFTVSGEIHGSPAIGADGTIYIGSNDHRLYAISAEDGTKRWDFFTNGVIDASPVIGPDGTVYVGSGDTYFYAFNPHPNAQERVKWKMETRITNPTTAAVRADGVIIFGGDDNVLRALHPDTGRELWRFTGVQGDADAIFGGPTVAVDGSIYFGSQDGFLYGLQGNGSPLSILSSWPALGRDSTHSGRVERVAREGTLVNLSARVRVGSQQESIMGFYAAGNGVHLLRAAGPALADYGVTGFMADPRLQLYFSDGTPVPGGANDDWEIILPEPFALGFSGRTTAPGAFPLRPGSKDAAVALPLLQGAYTAKVWSGDGAPGIVLGEVYSDIGDAPARLLNLSTRNHTGTGENVLIAGFVVGGTEPTRLLLRGVGPGLAQFNVPGFLAQPRLELYRGETRLRENDGWRKGGLGYDLMAAARSVGAFPLELADCAIIAVLPPDNYTIRVSGVNGTSGEALAEIYVLP